MIAHKQRLGTVSQCPQRQASPMARKHTVYHVAYIFAPPAKNQSRSTSLLGSRNTEMCHFVCRFF